MLPVIELWPTTYKGVNEILLECGVRRIPHTKFLLVLKEKSSKINRHQLYRSQKIPTAKGINLEAHDNFYGCVDTACVSIHIWYIIWYFTCNCITKTIYAFQIFLFKRLYHAMKWDSDWTVVKIINDTNSPSPHPPMAINIFSLFKSLILIICIDMPYNLNAFVFFVISFVHNT